LKNIIPYEKEIEFDTKISEITSISLEHKEEIKDNEIEGYFTVFGDYKVHQISINKENFKYDLPFTIELTDDIDINSIKLDVSDFTYDIKDNKLIVKIELLFESNVRQEVEVEKIENVSVEKEDEELNREIEKLIEDNKKIDNNKIEEVNEVNEVNIIENNTSDTYVIYHVYVVGKEDTLDSICQKFNVSKDLIHKYNDFEELKENDKLLIPKDDE